MGKGNEYSFRTRRDAIGNSNEVPTTKATATDTKQLKKIAEWYVKSAMICNKPDIEAATIQSKWQLIRRIMSHILNLLSLIFKAIP